MFDRRLSRSIDAIHCELDRLHFVQGWRAQLRRAYLRWKLRRLERRIP